MKPIYFCLLLLLLSCARPTQPSQTIPQETEAPQLQFAIIGDYGSRQAGEAQVARMLRSWNPEFVVTLGDNNYGPQTLEGLKTYVGNYYNDFIYNPDAPEAYRADGKAAIEQRNRFFPLVGNHDATKNGGRDIYLEYFSLPGKELYYDIRWGDVHLFMLDSGPHGESSCCNSEQSLWLKKALAASTAPYKLVCFHHPPYAAISRKSYHKMRWPFEKWGASIVLTGHDHVYARIASKNNPDFFYLINGLGGARKYECNPFQLPERLFQVFCYDQNFGAIKAKVFKDQLLLEFYSIDQKEPVDVVAVPAATS